MYQRLPGSCQFRICIICGVDRKGGGEFIGNKQTNSVTHSLAYKQTLNFYISTEVDTW